MKIFDLLTKKPLGTVLLSTTGPVMTLSVPANSGLVFLEGLPTLPSGHGWANGQLGARVTERNSIRGTTVLQVDPAGGTFTFVEGVQPTAADQVDFDLDVIGWWQDITAQASAA